jgi:RNA polymerase sigma-70 factor, ECF subfamily
MASSPEAGHLSADPSGTIAAAYGFLPNLFLAQTELPAAVAAESELISAILLRGPALSRADKNAIVSLVALSHSNNYVFQLHERGDSPPVHRALLEFTGKLARHGPYVSKHDIDHLQHSGLSDGAILEAIATVALGKMLCTLADALHPPLDLKGGVEMPAPPATAGNAWNTTSGPYLISQATIPNGVASVMRDQYGFVPGLFRSQALWPDLLAAEATTLELILFNEEHLTRIQKESILLAVSAANLNSYGAALHTQVLNVLGASADVADAIFGDLETSSLPIEHKTLLSQVSRLIRIPAENAFESKALSDTGFGQLKILEAIVTASLGTFFNTLQFGLGVPPDFDPPKIFTEKDLYPSSAHVRPTSDARTPEDPDAGLVARVQQGETGAFEDLVRRHTRRVFGTLHAILGEHDEARDATQDVFLKAFEHIGKFEGRSKFSTWLTSIAVNTGTEILRQRRPIEQLDMEGDECFRPRQVQGWAEDPERLFAASQVNALVRDAVLRLPQKYRVAVLLRDINQLTTEDAAQVLGLSVPALKARVLRGRLMLRESLAPHFMRPERADA